MGKIDDVIIDERNKHSFQEVEEAQNQRLKEELTFAIINDLKMCRQVEGILTLSEIAKAIKEGISDDSDAKVLGGLLLVVSSKYGEVAEKKKKINYFYKSNPNTAEKIMNALLS